MNDDITAAVAFLVWITGLAPLWWWGFKYREDGIALIGMSMTWAFGAFVISIILRGAIWSVSTIWHAIF